MAWTTPRTWVTGETVTAAQMNAHIRDNFRETSPFTVTTAGDLSYADAANSMNSRLAIGGTQSHLVTDGSDPIWRNVQSSNRTDSETATTTSYVTLAATGASNWVFAAEVDETVVTGTHAIVMIRCRLANSTAGAFTHLSFSVSGATTIAASNGNGIRYESGGANDTAEFAGFTWLSTLTGGSNVFTLEGKVDSGVGTIGEPRLLVIPVN